MQVSEWAAEGIRYGCGYFFRASQAETAMMAMKATNNHHGREGTPLSGGAA
jgi:hypothetical protein